MNADDSHLSYDEVAKVLELVQGLDVIVVGGQSMAIWARHYSGKNPDIAAVYAMSSQDVDFYGDRKAAEAFAAMVVSPGYAIDLRSPSEIEADQMRDMGVIDHASHALPAPAIDDAKAGQEPDPIDVSSWRAGDHMTRGQPK